jgi:serine/threonine-protein kinase
MAGKKRPPANAAAAPGGTDSTNEQIASSSKTGARSPAQRPARSRAQTTKAKAGADFGGGNGSTILSSPLAPVPESTSSRTFGPLSEAEVRARAKTESVVVRSAAPSTAIQRPVVSSASAMPGPVDSERSAVPAIEAEPIRARSTRRLSVSAVYSVLITAFVLTVGVIAALRMRPWRSVGSVAGTGAGGPSIAVLPLASVGADPRDAALAAGLSEELMGMIAKIHRLRVVGSTSAAIFKNSTLDARRIADSLGVSNVFEGSVQRDGQRIRVQVRLVDARDGSARWSETYNRELKDIFLVQSDIANAIARELDVRVGGGTVDELRRPPTENIAAYELYLRGNDPVLLRSDSGARLGLEYFKQAIALDSTFAGAYAGLAQLYLRLLQSQRAAIPARDLYVLADAAARKAVALDDSLAGAHDMVGVVRMAQYDLVEAEKELTRAVALDPGDRRVSQQLARLYAWKERPADALSYANHAVEVDPLSPSPHVELARALCANGKYAEGLAELKRLESVRPPVLRVALFTSQCHAMNRDWPAAVAALQQWRENRGRGFLAYSLARGGQRQEALAVTADLTNHWQQTKQGAFEVAVAYAGLGNHDRAFEWIDRSFDDFSLNEWIMLPLFDDLHADPRFERLRKRLLHHNL